MLLNTIFYDWILPNKQAFINEFKDDDAKRNAAKAFVSSLSNCDLLLFITCVGLTLAACISYYTWYNKIVKPWGYHYRKRHWTAWLVIALILTFLAAKLFCIPLLKNVGLQGTDGFIWRFYIGNAIYTVVGFFIISFVWCSWLPTNAYRWLKFKQNNSKR